MRTRSDRAEPLQRSVIAVLAVTLALFAAACTSEQADPIAATTIPNLAFTDTTPLAEPVPVLDEGAALTCLHLRDGIEAVEDGDISNATSSLSAASLYIASTTTPGFTDHVRALVLFASSPGPDTSPLDPLLDLCDSVLTN